MTTKVSKDSTDQNVILTRNVDLLTSHNNDLLPVEDQFSDDGSETSIHVASAVDDNSLGGKARHSSEMQRV